MRLPADVRAERWLIARARVRNSFIGDDGKGAALAALDALLVELTVAYREVVA